MKRQPKAFLCHSSSDKPFVRTVAQCLESSGVDIWIDEVEIRVGESLIEKIGEGIHQSDMVVAFISKSSVASPWVQKELSLAMTREVQSKRITVLPLLVEKCVMPYFLRDKLYANFTDGNHFEVEFDRLLQSIQHHIETASAANKHVSNSPGDALGSVDVGAVVHDRGQEFFGYKVVRSHQRMGIAISFQGMLFGLVSAIPAFVFHDQAMAILVLFFGVFVAFGGVLLILSAQMFRSAFDSDKRILLHIEAIGSALPFSRRWWQQYELGKQNRTHHCGLMCETAAYLIWIADIVFLLVMFPVLM